MADFGVLEIAGIAAAVGGTIISAVGASNAGKAQQDAANYSAEVANQAAANQAAAGSSAAMEADRKKQLALQENTAKAAAAGVDPGFGSPLANTGKIAKWGTYNQLLDIYNGSSAAQGLAAQAQGDIYGGQQAAAAGQWNAAGSIIGGVSSLASKYGDFSSGSSSTPPIGTLTPYG